MGKDGVVHKEEVEVLLMLSGIFADHVALPKLMRCLGHDAYLQCPFCLINGTCCDDDVIRFYGYNEPVYTGPGEVKKGMAPPPTKKQKLATELEPLTHVRHVQRARRVDEGVAEPSWVGSHGSSAVVAALDYVAYD